MREHRVEIRLDSREIARSVVERLQTARQDWHAIDKVRAQHQADEERARLRHIASSSPRPGRSWAMGELTNPEDTTAAPGGW